MVFARPPDPLAWSFYSIQGWFSFFLRRARPRTIWWCLSLPTLLTGGSTTLLTLWIRTLKARASFTSQSRQTHSEQSCLEPFCTPHIFVAFLLFFDGRRPVGCATGHHSLFMLCATSNIVPVTVLPFANFLSSAIPKMFPSVCRVFMPYFSVVRCD